MTTVNRIKKKSEKNEPVSSNRHGRCRGHRKTTPRDERKIHQIALQNRRKSKKALHNLVTDAGVKISVRTLQWRLKEQGFQCCRPSKKPRLTRNMIEKRLNWAKEHRNWSVEDWTRVRNKNY